jgi:ATP-binding cassette subfamily B protein
MDYSDAPSTGSAITARTVLKIYWQKVKNHPYVGLLTLVGVLGGAFLNVLPPLYYKDFFDLLHQSSDKSAVVPQLLDIVLLVFLINMGAWAAWRFATFANAHFQTSIMAELKQQAFEYLLGHSHSFFANSFTGSLVQKVNRFSRAFEQLADRVTWNIIPLIVRVTSTAVILYFINQIVMYVLLVWLVIFLACNYLFARWKLKYDIAGAAADSKTTAVLADDITNANNIQLFTAAAVEQERFKNVSEDQAHLQRFRWWMDSIMEGVQGFLVIAMEFVLFYYALIYWERGLLTLGVFVLIQAYYISLVASLWDFSRVIRNIYEAFADAKEMVELLEKPQEIRDVPGAKDLGVTKGEVVFKDVTFYFNATRVVLNKVNLTIKSGEKVALIGPSGAGKSTFFRLLLRFYDVSEGKILLDDQNVQKVTQESLRESISLVPQDALLFHRTLKENIRYGRRDATDEEVIHAAKLAHCDEFVKDLPQGYDTYVGERGIKLSGGERQRVAIARAILKNAPILLLDEATSSLDSHSEALIQDALEELMKGKTTIVIAHRLSTIRKMDRIVVLDKGVIAESGTHDELLSQEGSLYKKLWTLQSGGFLGEGE